MLKCKGNNFLLRNPTFYIMKMNSNRNFQLFSHPFC